MAIWTEETEDQFINLIQERPPLFDTTEKRYTNRGVKIQLWREIEEKLVVSEKELKKRWDSLRTQYTRYRRLPSSGSSGAQRTGRQQWILNRLQFLEPHTKKSESVSNLREPLVDSDSPSERSETWTNMPEDSSFIEAPIEDASDCTESTFKEEPLPDTSRRSSVPRTRKRSKRARDESLSEDSSNLMRTITKTLDGLASQKDDDISAYCCNIEHRMRKLPPHLLPHFQHEVDNCLFKYSVQSLEYEATQSNCILKDCHTKVSQAYSVQVKEEDEEL